MHLCELKDKIETLLKRTTSSIQDLPGFYESSASLRGGDPGKHAKHSLFAGSGKAFVTKVKRSAITALAEIILTNLATLKQNGVDEIGKVKLTQHFQLAHKLFRFLNASCKEVVERSREPLPEVQAFCKCYMSIQSGYRISSIDFDSMDCDTLCAILEGALVKAKSMVQEAKDTKKRHTRKKTE